MNGLGIPDNRPRQCSVLCAAFVGALVLASCGGATQHQGEQSQTTRAQTEKVALAVQVISGTNVAKLARSYGAEVTGGDEKAKLLQLTVSAREVGSILRKMRADPRIRHAEPDAVLVSPEANNSIGGNPIHVPFDFSRTYRTFSSDGSAASDTGTDRDAYRQVNLSDVHAVARGAGVIVAVLDTGVQSDHPDLKGNVLEGFNALSLETAPEDIADGITNRAIGHGTMVSGIIARMAPEAKILPVRVLNADGRGSIVSTVLGIRHAVKEGAKVLNLSLGSPFPSQIMDEAIQAAQTAGCVVVAAAGNLGATTPQYPAACPGVLSILAVDKANRKASFSNYGRSVTLAAPGVAVRSTFVGGGYASWSGTSFAAPFVSAAAALTFSAHPDWTANRVSRSIGQSARPINSLNSPFAGEMGKGILDVRKAVREGVSL